ncbi:hypothetical protein HDV04_004294 [Boothiomyces sp. JEL0838]|nr:hypothetical protein HDV04_004294 [Boothiomyces sp. JEL0838]
MVLNLLGLIHRIVLNQLPPLDVKNKISDAIQNDLLVVEGHLTGLSLLLINIQTLNTFKILDERITKTKVNMLYTFYSSYIVFAAAVHVAGTFINSINVLVNATLLIEMFTSLFLDNFIGIFLSVTLYKKLRQVDVEQRVVKTEIAGLILGNIIAIYNSRNYYYFTQYAFVCMQSIIIIAMFLKYKRIALLKRQDELVESKKPTLKKLLMEQNSNKTGEAATVLTTQIKRD